MYRLRHPLTGSVYSAVGGGMVEVESADRRGIFDGDGNWQSGDVRWADAEMCRWVSTAGTGGSSRHARNFSAMSGSGVAREFA